MKEALVKLLTVLGSQVPLAGALAVWHDWAQQHPVPTALLGVAYEACLLALAFGKKVWAKLEDRAVQRVADSLLALPNKIAPGFPRRYMKMITREHGVFNVRGLGLINTYTLSLEQVYVELRIDPSNPQKFNLDLIAEKNVTSNRPVWEFLRSHNPKDERGFALAVIGPPGCGKTTLIQHVAVSLALNRQRRYGVRRYTPILIFLRDHLNAVTQPKPRSLGQLAQGYFGDPELFPALNPPPDWFEKRLRRGKCVVLLDGLDEVAEVEQRTKVSEWVDAQVKNYPGCCFILTARPQGYRDAPLQRANVLEVQPFNRKQVRRFTESWYLANEIMSSGGKRNEDVKQRASKGANDLLNRLRNLPSLNALTVNPLLLTMVAMVHRYHGALPGTRVELYAEICEVLLGRWRQARGVKDNLKAAQKLVVLRPLAAHMMEREIRDISLDEILQVIKEPLSQVGSAENSAAAFLNDMQASSGLLIEREAGQWSFAHLSFQEYLTAAHWLEQKSVTCDWEEMVGKSWWHETLRLYAAQGDATALITACLEVDTLPSLTLTADCLNEVLKLDPGVRLSAEERVVADLESRDDGRRRLAAAVRLSRRLKSLQQLGERVEVDTEFVTCAEYQMFVDDMIVLGQFCQPDHWPGIIFPLGTANEPVRGVRSQDAEKFCAWLAQREGGNFIYRLPTVDEAQAIKATANCTGAWCQDGGGKRLSALSADKASELSAALRASLITKMPPPDLEADLYQSFSTAKGIAKSHEKMTVLISQLGQALRDAARYGEDIMDIQIGNARILANQILSARNRLVAPVDERDPDYGNKMAAKISADLKHIWESAIELARQISKDFDGLPITLDESNVLLHSSTIGGLRNAPNNRISNVARILDILLMLTDLSVVDSLREERIRFFAQVFENLYFAPEKRAAPVPLGMKLATYLRAALILTLPMRTIKWMVERDGDTQVDEELLELTNDPSVGRLKTARKFLADIEPVVEQSREEVQAMTLNAFWWVVIVHTRRKSGLPAWEGIRIAREHSDLQ